jgi:uncharacterized protein
MKGSAVYASRRFTNPMGCFSGGILLLFFAGNAVAMIGNPASSQPVPRRAAQPFSVGEVRLLDGPFKHAEAMCAAYLLQLEPDRLLAWFRREAGLDAKAPVYGGWETKGVAGHSAGHYLSACAFAWRATGDPRFRDRAAYMVDELAQCQQANGNGYLAAIPEGKRIFEEVARGEIRSQGFDLNGGWVPWYTLHKLFAGLRDVYLFCDNENALEVACILADWAVDVTKNLDKAQWQAMLACEHGGMNETLADLYAFTGRTAYLDLAKKFYHETVLDPLAHHRDELEGKHANTQIPKLSGCARIFELTNEERFGEASRFFWETVTRHHAYVIGGNSESEHFGPPGRLNDRLSDQTCETCNTYNMLKLTHLLFMRAPGIEYADYAERALWNHILASQNPDDGMVCYFVPLRTGGQKQFMTPFDHFTCCSGTGMENHVRYAESLFFHDNGGLFVNQFIPAVLNWREKGLRLRLESGLPASGAVKLVFDLDKPLELALRIRHPHWAQEAIPMQVNGEDALVSNAPQDYAVLHRTWKSGDTVTFDLPLALRTETMPDNPQRIALFYGPVLLAAGIDPLEDGAPPPAFVTDERPVNEWIQGVPGPAPAFRSQGVGRPDDLTFTPFYRLHGQPHLVYFDLFTAPEWAAHKEALRAEAQRRAEIAARTIDQLRVGEMQPERDHKLEGENTGAGEWKGRKWRHATDGGWFAFDLAVLPDAPVELVVDYWGSETGPREFEILVDGIRIATQKLDMDAPEQFFEVVYPLPRELTQGREKVTLRFQARPGNFAGGIFGARMMKTR